MKHESTQPNTSGDLCRRNFLRLLSPGTIGLGFGVSIFTRGYAMAEEADEETAHQQLMRGTKDFKGVRISEITPNERGTFRNQAAFNDEVPIPAFGEAMRLDTDLRSSKRAQ